MLTISVLLTVALGIKLHMESVRYDAEGAIRLMAQAEGYCMCIREGGKPFIMYDVEWRHLPTKPAEKP
jgi:hypothetical protein